MFLLLVKSISHNDIFSNFASLRRSSSSALCCILVLISWFSFLQNDFTQCISTWRRDLLQILPRIVNSFSLVLTSHLWRTHLAHSSQISSPVKLIITRESPEVLLRVSVSSWLMLFQMALRDGSHFYIPHDSIAFK